MPKNVETRDYVSGRWFVTMDRLRPSKPDAASRLLAEVIERYTEEGRYYHNLAHLRACFEILDHLPTQPTNQVEIEMALWYHDLVYDTKAKDNEYQSGIIARSRLMKDLGMTANFTLCVFDLIMVTRHDRAPITPDAKALVDIDLSILGADPTTFAQYDEDIRREYSWVPPDAYRSGRAKVLNSFLERPFIYHTPYFKERYESQARVNLHDALELLGE